MNATVLETAWRNLRDWDFGDPNAEDGYRFAHKLVKKTGWSDSYASRVVEAFRRFVLLWIAAGEARLTPPPAVDEAWHLALQYTERYAQMCERFLGDFRHHSPATSVAEESALSDTFPLTIKLYREVFGKEPSPDVWSEQPSPDVWSEQPSETRLAVHPEHYFDGNCA